MDRVQERSDTLLLRLRENGVLTEAEYRLALAETPDISGMQKKVDKNFTGKVKNSSKTCSGSERGWLLLGGMLQTRQTLATRSGDAADAKGIRHNKRGEAVKYSKPEIRKPRKSKRPRFRIFCCTVSWNLP